jgi:hypothetical protein
MDDKLEISKFIKKRKAKSVDITKKEDTADKPTPWYRRPLKADEFISKLAKNGRYYARHNEWGKTIWIGPYKDIKDVNNIIKSYVIESLKGSLSRKYNEEIHSVVIEDPDDFF